MRPMRHEFELKGTDKVCKHCGKRKELVRGDEICPARVAEALGAEIIAENVTPAQALNIYHQRRRKEK